MANPIQKIGFGIVLGASFSVCLASLALSSGNPLQSAPQDPAPGILGIPGFSKIIDAQAILARSSFNEVAQSALPSVVSISVIKIADHDQRSLGLGSGVIIRKNGFILTNHHVVDSAEKITVTLEEKTKLTAHLVGTDPKTDLAVIKLDSHRTDLHPLAFGDSGKIKIGDWALAIGSPFGLNRSVSSGIISAKGRAQMGILDIEDFIQTDAAINPGSSGGPLLNLIGEMIGINTAIFTQGAGFVGIGFAIPSLIAKEISDQLIDHGKIERGWLGLAAQDLDEDLALYFNFPSKQGALVSDVLASGPAASASIQAGDVITHFDHHLIDSAAQLKQLSGKKHAGEKVPLTVVRQGKIREVAVQVAAQPQSTKESPSNQQAGQIARLHPKTLGLVVDDIPNDLLKFLNVTPGLGAIVSSVEPGSPAFESGIAPGDIILGADQTPIHSAREFAKIAHKQREAPLFVLYLQRGPEEKFFVPVKRNS